MCQILDEISAKMQIGKVKEVKTLCTQALESGIPAQDVLEKGLLSGMSIIGRKFKNNEIFVPDVLVAAKAMTKGTEVLKPYLAADAGSNKGTVVIGTVKGDLHDIGKNLVRMMMEGKGLKVIDLGVDVSAEEYVTAAKENDADIIACSALLTTTMSEMEEVVKKADEAGIRERVKIMLGGAPLTQEFCDSVGADFYTADATTAAETALEICKG